MLVFPLICHLSGYFSHPYQGALVKQQWQQYPDKTAALKMTFQKYFYYSQGSVVVDAELIFNNVTTLPNASSAAETLVTSASSSNFSLTVNTSSVTATSKTMSLPNVQFCKLLFQEHTEYMMTRIYVEEFTLTLI